jgi:hypothetical protein
MSDRREGETPSFGSEVPGGLETANRSLTSNTPRRPRFSSEKMLVTPRTDGSSAAGHHLGGGPPARRRDSGRLETAWSERRVMTSLGGEQSPWKKRATQLQQWCGSSRTRRRSKALESSWTGPILGWRSADATEVETPSRCGRGALRSSSGGLEVGLIAESGGTFGFRGRKPSLRRRRRGARQQRLVHTSVRRSGSR